MKTFAKQLALITTFLYIQSATGLQCMTCSDLTCSFQTPKNCTSKNTLCFSSVTEESYFYRRRTVRTWTQKGCASADMCTSTGDHFVSYNTNFEAHLINTSCCDTDNCNAADPILSSVTSGSLQCYGCDPWSYECTANLTCNAQESCFQTSTGDYGSPQPFFGCASESVCNNTNLSHQYFSNNVSCCNTSHCNIPELGIQCMACSDSTCSSRHWTMCSTYAPMCFSYTYAGSYNVTSIEKGCAPPSSICKTTENLFVSYRLGSEFLLLNITCCDTDGCNAVDELVAPPAGSLQCYSCDRHSGECTAGVTCNALEVCSMTAHNPSRPIFGCVSESLCNNVNVSQYFFGYDGEISCCNKNNCNVPPTTVPPPTAITPPTDKTTPTAIAPPTDKTTPTAIAPPTDITTPMTTDEDDEDDDDDDCSVFSAADCVKSLSIPLSLLGLCAHIIILKL